VLIDVAMLEDRNVIKNEAEKILKYKYLTTEMERKSKCDTCNNRGNSNHLKIIHKILQQHTGKARNQGTTENGHIGHGTHRPTSESTKVKLKYSRFNIGISAICTMDSNYRIAATLYSLDMVYFKNVCQYPAQ
jgi:hypothetical protein